MLIDLRESVRDEPAYIGVSNDTGVARARLPLFRAGLAVLAMLNFLDAILSDLVVRSGVGSEGNPIVNLLTPVGSVWFWLFKLGVSLTFIWVLACWNKRLSNAYLVAVLTLAAFYAAIVVHNIRILLSLPAF